MHGSEDRRINSLSTLRSGPEHRQAAHIMRALRWAVIFERLATLSDMQAEDRERRAARMPTVEDNQPPEKGALGVPQGSPSRTKGGPGAG